jgi:flagellar motor switch protein FliN/FliY
MSIPRAPVPQQPDDDADRARDSVSVRRVEFPSLADTARESPPLPTSVLANVEVSVAAVLGAAKITVREIIDLRPGSLIELDRMAGEPVDLRVNNVTVAGGEVIVIDDRYAVRINSFKGRGGENTSASEPPDRGPSGEGTQDDASDV